MSVEADHDIWNNSPWNRFSNCIIHQRNNQIANHTIPFLKVHKTKQAQIHSDQHLWYHATWQQAHTKTHKKQIGAWWTIAKMSQDTQRLYERKPKDKKSHLKKKKTIERYCKASFHFVLIRLLKRVIFGLGLKGLLESIILVPIIPWFIHYVLTNYHWKEPTR